MLRTALRRDCLRTLARPLLVALLAGTHGGVVAQAGSGAAQATPSTLSTKSLRIIVPYAAGGPIDLSVRVLADRVRGSFPGVVVENRPGAGGNIGALAVARAVPDGATIGIAATATHAVNPWLFKRMPYDARSDFAPITQILRVPNVLVMTTETARRLGIGSLADFVKYAKANPAKLNYGSGGLGSAGHLAGEMFKTRAGIFAVHIPYQGGAPAQLGLLAGQVDFNFDNLATAAANIRSGKLLALAVTTQGRSPLLPEIPAVAELFPGFAVDTWWGLVAPAATPAGVVQQLHEVFVQALAHEDTRQRFAALMAEPLPSTPEAFGRFLQAELAKYEAVVKQSGASVD
ncbi:MAG: tripartite tricarboxylate transporter substrate binding protein [Betaproteobacteria bacterium]|nr:tripartite tricarboxylate transporter substrate binding protein [Betaproteobacteria bacterium]